MHPQPLANPLVSVIITTYNRAPLLVQAIESVHDQRFVDYELLVADDGSTDDTAACVTALDAPLRYLRLPHSSRPEVARNRALAHARGRYVAFLDDDDLWHPDKLARQVGIMEGAPGVGLVYSDVQLQGADGTRSASVLRPHQTNAQRALDHLLMDCFVHPSTVLVRHSLLARLGGFDERFFSQGDYHLWLRAAHAMGVACVTEPMVYVRHHRDGLSRQRDLLHYENAIAAVEDVRRTLPLSLRQRLYSRRGLARLHIYLGAALMEGEAQAARSHLRAALRLDPLQRRAWRLLSPTPPADEPPPPRSAP